MNEASNQIESRLVELVRAGDRDGWNDLIHSFQKRLLAFAVRQIEHHELAEDLVQETFVSFLKSIDRFRHECDLETFLFQILRRRIVDWCRRNGREKHIHACGYADSLEVLAGTEVLAARFENSQQSAENEATLSDAIRAVTEQLCKKNKFRDLQIAEATLYASLCNRVAANLIGCSAEEVAVVKHRVIGKLSKALRAERLGYSEHYDDTLLDGMFARAWEANRPSCPKRTTLGKHLLGILPGPWGEHVQFHVHKLECRFCQANLNELSEVVTQSDSQTAERLFESTVGFLNSV